MIVSKAEDLLLHLQVDSQVMLQAREMWGPLKLAQLKGLFETADVESDRASKRARQQ